MIGNGIRLFNYYESVWNTGSQYFKINRKIAYHMKLYTVTELTRLKDDLSEEELNKLISMITELKEIKKKLLPEETTIQKKDYIKFYKNLFLAIDKEDKEKIVSFQTSERFNYVSDVLEAYKFWEKNDNNILILQAYCRYKAKLIEDNLKKGLVPGKMKFQDFKYINGMEYQYFTACDVNGFNKSNQNFNFNNNNVNNNNFNNQQFNNNNMNNNNSMNNNNNNMNNNNNNNNMNNNMNNNNMNNNNINNNSNNSSTGFNANYSKNNNNKNNKLKNKNYINKFINTNK